MYGFVNLLKKTHRTRSVNFALCSPACRPTKHCWTKRKAASKTQTYSSAPKSCEHFVPTTCTTSEGPQLGMGPTSAHQQSAESQQGALLRQLFPNHCPLGGELPAQKCLVYDFQELGRVFKAAFCHSQVFYHLCLVCFRQR